MNKEYKRIDIVFENCEVVEIPSSNIELFDTKLSSKWLFSNWSCNRKNKDFYMIGHTDADYIRIHIKLKNLSEENKKYLRTRKDITHIDIIYKDNSNEYIRVPEPTFYNYCFSNPHQTILLKNSYDKNNEIVCIYIEPSLNLSLLKILFKDWFIHKYNSFISHIKEIFI